MPVGVITPGNWISVSPDTITELPASFTYVPSPTMQVISANMQSLALQMVTNDQFLNDTLAADIAALATYKNDVANDTNNAKGSALVGHNTYAGTYWTLHRDTVRNVFIQIVDNLGSTVSTGDGSGVSHIGIETYAGARFTIAAAPVRTFLRDVADYAARVDLANTWLGAQTFQSGYSLEVAASRDGSTLTAGDTTVDIDTTQPFWEHHCDGVDTTEYNCTVADYGGTLSNPEIELLVTSLHGTADPNFVKYHVRRADGTGYNGTIIVTAVFQSGDVTRRWGAYIKLRWRAGAWRLIGATTNAQNATDVAFENATHI